MIGVEVERSDTMLKKRCCWAEDVPDIYVKYHDEEWGEPVYDDRHLFEMLILEGFQAGLSWLTILKKREAFQRAFDNFDVVKVAAYDEAKLEELRNNKDIVRNRLKISAAVKNAKAFIQIQQEYGSFHSYLWHFTDHKVIDIGNREMPVTTPLSDEISKDLKKRGMTFVGSTIMYSYLQAVGVVNDHAPGCFKHIHQK